MALNTVSSDRLSTNVKTSNLGTELKKKVGQTKNLIINGAMQVAQRGTSSGSSGYKTIDRFQFQGAGLNASVTTSQADVAAGTTPYTLGFRKSYKITNGAQTGPDAGDKIEFITKLEAQDIANSGWNYTSSSSFITLSFWVKSSVAQNFFGYIITLDGTSQNFPFETGSLSADTWTKITKVIPGNTNLQFDNNNSEGLRIVFQPFMGTSNTGSVSLNAWAAFNGSVRTPNQTSTWYTTDGATWEFTGVQLEVGSVATDFEHRSFGEELTLCERYFEKSYNYSTVAGTATDTGLVMWLANRNPGLPHTTLRYKSQKRANPTVTIFNTNTADSNTLRDKDAATDLTPQITRLGESGCTIHTNTSTALGNFIAFHYTAESEL